MKRFARFTRNSMLTLLSLMLSGFVLIGCLYFYMALKLPDVASLKHVQMQVPLRIYTSDGKLIGVYGEKRRIPVTFKQVPKLLINGLIATEDQRFYDHPGVDVLGLLRATKELIITGRKVQGASTITMQVARNFYLSPKKTYVRKINEILLALKINGTLSKNKILELYVNKIYLGQRAYGVAAAAAVYYGKPLNQLNLAQIAMIAGLPQAPSRDNPISNPEGALKRRNHVLDRMLDRDYITKTQYQQAIAQPITASYHGQKIQASAPYIAEMVRSALLEQYGKNAYNAGLKVYTTINSNMQKDANNALQNGLIAYSERHGYRKPTENLGKPSMQALNHWLQTLKNQATYNGLRPAAVMDVENQSVTALLSNGATITIPWAGLSWAKPALSKGRYGFKPKTASQILKVGDVIRVRKSKSGSWELTQLPDVEGALISINPHDGAIEALTGGFSYPMSNYNRATQAERQPGSSFKPFVYSAALAKGYTLATIINDAPIVEQDFGGENSLWRPQNDSLRFYGPTPLRIGLIQSRNLVSIRLLRDIGVPYAINYLQRFGFDPANLPHGLSLALGSASVTPMEMASGYTIIANGGHKTTPYFIEKIVDESGKTIYNANPMFACNNNCTAAQLAHQAPQAISPQVSYLMTHAMQGVIKYGTGRAALTLKRSDLAGKTGTTNDQIDAWFSGFNSDLVTTVWVGFDQPKSLHEYGAQAALPIWINFMGAALKGKPEATLPQPADIINVRIDPNTGLLANPGQRDARFEYFRQQFAPTQYASEQNADQTDSFDAEDNASAQIF